jgi:hypothetical protein
MPCIPGKRDAKNAPPKTMKFSEMSGSPDRPEGKDSGWLVKFYTHGFAAAIAGSGKLIRFRRRGQVVLCHQPW